MSVNSDTAANIPAYLSVWRRYQTSMPADKSKPFALADTLHDLALIRASDVDLSGLIPDRTTSITEEPGVLKSVELSHEFVAETRAALRAYNSGDMQRKNVEIQKAQAQLEELLRGLSP